MHSHPEADATAPLRRRVGVSGFAPLQAASPAASTRCRTPTQTSRWSPSQAVVPHLQGSSRLDTPLPPTKSRIEPLPSVGRNIADPTSSSSALADAVVGHSVSSARATGVVVRCTRFTSPRVDVSSSTPRQDGGRRFRVSAQYHSTGRWPLSIRALSSARRVCTVNVPSARSTPTCVGASRNTSYGSVVDSRLTMRPLNSTPSHAVDNPSGGGTRGVNG